jgi:photoactive yellow protein
MTSHRTLLPEPFEPLDDVIFERDRLREQVSELRLAYREKELEIAALMRQIEQLSFRPGAAPTAPQTLPHAPAPAPPRRTLREPPRAAAGPPRGEPDLPVATHSSVADPSQGIDFGAVAKLSPAELDSLPYGLITLNADGMVLHYNDTESRLVGLPRERVLGKSFFRDVAPCTRLREFEGRFLELARDPARVRVQTFDFVFRFPRAEHHVTVIMTPARTRGQFHLALVRRAIIPA